MKINKDVFFEKLSLASKFTSQRTSSSSLQGILLKKEDENLNFYSTNLNFYYKGTIKIKNDEKFSIVIEPKKIIEFLSLVYPGEIEIIISNNKISINQNKTKGEFQVISSSDFPILKNKNHKKQKIDIKKIKKIFPLISFSASSDETRPVLTGINFDSIDEMTNIVATDGFRLSLYSLKEKIPFSSLIISSYFLNDIFKLSTNKDEIDFSFDEKEKLLTFYIGEDEFSTRLIEGEYPPYERVIPRESKTTAVVDREDFLRNIKIISIFTRDFSNITVLEIEKNQIKISPRTDEKTENFSFVEAETSGDPIKIAFNYKFLIDFLSKTNSQKIKIELLRQDAPTVFKLLDDDNFLHIIMPVRIQE